jgi:hypothetical protein
MLGNYPTVCAGYYCKLAGHMLQLSFCQGDRDLGSLQRLRRVRRYAKVAAECTWNVRK